MSELVTEKCAKRLPAAGRVKQLKITNLFLGQITRDRAGWGRAREESPAQSLRAAAATFILLTSDPVQAGIQAANAEERD